MHRNIKAAAALTILVLGYLWLVGELQRRANRAAPTAERAQLPAPRQSFLFELSPMPALAADQMLQGTAFYIGGPGLWLTARHVVSPCMAGHFRGTVQGRPIDGVSLDSRNDVALLKVGGNVPPREALHLAYLGQREAQEAEIVGFPSSQPVGLRVERLGEGSARSGGSSEGISVWVETERVPAGDYPLGGMSGAPVVDSLRNVVGVLSAEVPRRGRVLVARVGDWIATQSPRLITARTIEEQRSPHELVAEMATAGTIGRVHCST